MRPTTRQSLIAFGGWIVVVVLFAALWYAYDCLHNLHEPFRDYLGWAWMIWLVLTPLVIWFGIRYPVSSSNWKQAVPLLIAASIGFAAVQLSIETTIGWLRHHLTLAEAARHYFSQHILVSLLTYWVLIAALQYYRIYDSARKRELRAARAEAQLAAAQLEILRAQLHPHFVFNTLQAATELIHSDPDGAELVLVELSDLLRAALDDSHLQEVPLDHELELLDHYMNIQKRRFGDRLHFQVAVDPALHSYMVPALVLQPLVENAVRHGIARNKGDDTIAIQARRCGARMQLQVSNRSSSLDDAPGSVTTRGVGLAITQERLEQLYAGEYAFELRNVDPRGVCATIVLPLRTAEEGRP